MFCGLYFNLGIFIYNFLFVNKCNFWSYIYTHARALLLSHKCYDLCMQPRAVHADLKVLVT